jgi:hypothetical protein
MARVKKTLVIIGSILGGLLLLCRGMGRLTFGRRGAEPAAPRHRVSRR